MKLWLLFSRRRGPELYPGDDNEWRLVGVFPYEKAAVMVGVPMAVAKSNMQFMIQRWTLGNVGPDPNEETVQ